MNSTVRRARRLLSLSAAERRVLVRAFFALLAMEFRLRFGGFRRVADGVPAARLPATSIDRDDLQRAHTYARWIELASRYNPARTRCLHRSLVLHNWLRREGLASDLRIGVRKDGSTLQAHAWVELGGEVIGESADAVGHFVPLPAYASEPAG